MDNIEKATKKHFNIQWGKRFKGLDSFGSKNFTKHLLDCTLTTPEDWKDKVVFEGGAGNGRNSLAVLQLRVKSLTATDLAPLAVDSIILNLSEYKEKIRAYAASLTLLDKEVDNSYDIVFSVNCVPHIPNYKDALKEMYRICKPKGLILFNVPPKRPELIAEVDTKIREYSKCMCPNCLELFSNIIVYIANKKELQSVLYNKMELSGDLLSAFDHFGLPHSAEFTEEQIINDIKEIGGTIEKIDNKINVRIRKE